MSGYLPDVNLLFAFLHPLHEDHARAAAWFERHIEPGSLLICRVVQMGTLRLLTSPAVMGVDLISPAKAWAGYARAMEDDRFLFVEEPPSLESTWQRLAGDVRGLVKIDTDTYLAAFALAGGHTLSKFDRGFVRYPGLRTEILEAS